MSETLTDERTSEQRYSIRKQPENGCPLIDDVLSNLETAMSAIRRYEKCDDVKELHDMLWRVECELSEIIGYRRDGKMEQIRQRMTDIRGWGQEWKELAKQYAPEEEDETP